MTSLSVFLGSFGIQSYAPSATLPPHGHQTTLCIREKTGKDRKEWVLSTHHEEKKYTELNYLSSFFSLPLWSSSEESEARWEQHGSRLLASSDEEAYIDSEGVWSLLSSSHRVPFALKANTWAFPIRLKPMTVSPWLSLPTVLDKKEGHVVVSSNKMRPGRNHVSVLAEDANKQSAELSFEAIGTTSSLTLAPWLFNKGAAKSLLKIQLHREEDGSFIGTLRLPFCGTGVLHLYLFDLPNGKSIPVRIENWDPLATVSHEQIFRWSNEQLLPFSKGSVLCHIETDGRIFGLQRAVAYSSMSPVVRLYSSPAHYLWPYPYHPFSLKFYRKESDHSISWVSSPLQDWSWRWADKAPEGVTLQPNGETLSVEVRYADELFEKMDKTKHYTLFLFDPKGYCCVFYLSFKEIIDDNSPTVEQG